MPSKARQKFDENANDIEHLIDLYKAMRKLFEEEPEDIEEAAFEVLCKSAVVLMVSHWEAYVEDIASESLSHLIENSTSADQLPNEIKKQISKEIKIAVNEIEMWKLADQNWKAYLRTRLEKYKSIRDQNFNTPKAHQTAEFIKNTMGIEDIRTSWKIKGLKPKDAATKLDKLVKIRAQIAHRGTITPKVDLAFVEEHSEFLKDLVSKTGGRIKKYLKDVTGEELW